MVGDSDLPREKIIAEALQMVRQEGAAALTIRSLARRLGRAPATIYSHFRSKDELLARVALHGFEQLLVATREATQRGDARQAIADGGRRYLDFALANPLLYKLMFEEFDVRPFCGAPDGSPAPGRELFDLYCELYARGVASGSIRAVDPQAQTLIAWSALHGFALLALAGHLPPPQLRAHFLEFLDHSLRP